MTDYRIVGLMIGNDPDKGPFLHEDGRPFTFAERRLIRQAGPEEREAAIAERLRLNAEDRAAIARGEQRARALQAEIAEAQHIRAVLRAYKADTLADLPAEALEQLGYVPGPADLAG